MLTRILGTFNCIPHFFFKKNQKLKNSNTAEQSEFKLKDLIVYIFWRKSGEYL